MNGRYSRGVDGFALALHHFATSDYSGMCCAAFFEPQDRVCDVAKFLDTQGAAVISTGKKEPLSRFIIRSKKFSNGLFQAGFESPMPGDPSGSPERLAWFLRSLSPQTIVFNDSHRWEEEKFLVLHQALSILSDKDTKKKIILLITGSVYDFNPILMSNELGWQIKICPRLSTDDVRAYFLMEGIAIETDAGLAKLLKFARSGPYGLSLVRNLSIKMSIRTINLNTALSLIEEVDSKGLERPMDEPNALVGITSSKARSRHANLKKGGIEESDED